MLDVEGRAHAALPPAKRSRFEFLLGARNGLARTSAELCCVGFVDAPMVDRYLVLLEDALTDMIDDCQLAATVAAAWAVNDAALLHETGTADWCSVCRRGRYGLEDLLGPLTSIFD